MLQTNKISLSVMITSITPESRSEFHPHANTLGKEIIDWGNAEDETQSDFASVSENYSPKKMI